MKRLRGAAASSAAILLIIILVAAVYLPLRVSAEPELSIPLYRSPRIDGVVSAGEYPVEQLSLPWGKAYAVHNNSYLFFALVLNNACRTVGLLFNTGFLNSTILTVSTTRYAVNRSGVLRYFYGHGEEWLEEPAGDILLRVVNGTVSWTIELAIPLSKLDVYPNRPRTLGFALIASGVGVNYSWPTDALLSNPSSWGVASSPDNWATRCDVALEGVYLDKKSLIAGSNLTLILVLRNKGDAAIPDYLITIMLDDALIVNTTGSQLGLKTPMVESDWVRFEKIIPNVTEGSHVVKVWVKALNVFHDSDEDNNFGQASFTARLAKISVFSTPGVTVELDGESQIITDETGVVFYTTYGVKTLRAQEIHRPTEGVRYVFTGWKQEGSTTFSPQLALTVEGDLGLTAEYRKEYLVNLSFVDKDNAPLQPSFYLCTLPNNTVYNGTLRGFWVTGGDLRLTMVKYAGLNVLDEAMIVYVNEPKEIRVSCNVVSGSVKVVDPFSMPIEGAELKVVFTNNTQAKYVTASGGTVNISRVAGGELTLTVTNLGYSATVKISFLTEREVTIRIPMSLNVVLIIIGAFLIVVIIIVFKILRARERLAPRKPEEYEFEEL
ncbi:MAG: carboxypeptidase regulatory-like domain-containing protein [Candidatus Brockarchaeota archaeon]|nr:carboxypeptidase regulatory-like domain-containing protein [Candidatus Brockarchaeota archaeon]